jgi:hypothetical protein
MMTPLSMILSLCMRDDVIACDVIVPRDRLADGG